MKIEIKEVYKCDFCKKLYQRSGSALKHEQVCSKNPSNKRACLNNGIPCGFLSKKNVVYYYDTAFGEGQREVELLYCTNKKIFVYPPKVELKNNMFDLGDELNEPMPKECEEYVEFFLNK